MEQFECEPEDHKAELGDFVLPPEATIFFEVDFHDDLIEVWADGKVDGEWAEVDLPADVKERLIEKNREWLLEAAACRHYDSEPDYDWKFGPDSDR